MIIIFVNKDVKIFNVMGHSVYNGNKAQAICKSIEMYKYFFENFKDIF